MPIPIPTRTTFDLFPTLYREQIDAARTSSWYDTFEDLTFQSTIVDLAELGEEEDFLNWLEEDSIFLPEGSEGRYAAGASLPNASSNNMNRQRSNSTSSDASSKSSISSEAPIYHLPKLNAAIRSALDKYGGSVFPKLNWTSPKDAAFILPQTASGPLYCTSPSDVYLLLKSSDFISHDLDNERAYAGCEEGEEQDAVTFMKPKLELVLKKYCDINPSREIRCFVRNNALIGITQRDNVFYDHLQSDETRIKICDTVRALWEDEVRENYDGGIDYVFDLYLSPNFQSAQIIDFQPYRNSTDPLLFTYEELLSILETAFEPLPPCDEVTATTTIPKPRLPIFKAIDSQSHPSANRNAPTYQSNMMPFEMIEFSQGRNLDEFKEAWEEALAQGLTE
ncbi:uncharacterized protein IL334_003680 [Kwoniella shivajii]|uniref:Cell division cycle protein 123 n=1 Tax=Kwoniella shivajii TaxID=564305 RepID=A0ABZ1D2A8_9TREE|nr:hypothetical protein IL334_003680 [Kwoniella shivajii]